MATSKRRGKEETDCCNDTTGIGARRCSGGGLGWIGCRRVGLGKYCTAYKYKNPIASSWAFLMPSGFGLARLELFTPCGSAHFYSLLSDSLIHTRPCIPQLSRNLEWSSSPNPQPLLYRFPLSWDRLGSRNLLRSKLSLGRSLT